jgi:CRISPR/Cas system-associated exonuclease Cas4 (RecB family)
MRVFAVGEMIHKWIQDVIRQKAKSFEIEYHIEDSKLFGSAVSGYIDCIARFNGKTTLYEFKSVNSHAFHFMSAKPYGANISHLMQAMTYWMILDHTKERKIDQARIVYFDKDSLRIKEIEVPDNDKIREAVRQDWTEIIGLYVRGVLPPAKPKEDYECRYCPFKDLCDKTEGKI